MPVTMLCGPELRRYVWPGGWSEKTDRCGCSSFVDVCVCEQAKDSCVQRSKQASAGFLAINS